MVMNKESRRGGIEYFVIKFWQPEGFNPSFNVSIKYT